METHIRTTGCRLTYGVRQCYLPPTQANAPRLNPSQWRAGTWFTYSGGMESWVDL